MNIIRSRRLLRRQKKPLVIGRPIILSVIPIPFIIITRHPISITGISIFLQNTHFFYPLNCAMPSMSLHRIA